MANGPPPPGQPQIVVPGQGWVDVASRAIVQVGFPVVVAGVLLWFLLTRFQENMNTITARMANNTTAIDVLIDQEKESFEELKKQTGYLAIQSQTIGEIAQDAAALVQIRKDELDEMRRRAK